MRYLLHLLFYRLLCYHLGVQCRLSCVTTALCLLVPFPSLPLMPLYLPPLLSGCAFLHRHVLCGFLEVCQLWQAPGCEYTRCACMRLYIFYKQPALSTIFSGSRPQWQSCRTLRHQAHALRCTHTIINPPCGKLLTHEQKVQQPNVLCILVHCCFVKLSLLFIVGMRGVNCGDMCGG